jgi:hypothetical protein
LTSGEYAELAAAAERVGLTTTGYVGEAALAAARGLTTDGQPDTSVITRPELAAPFADFTWRHARRLAAAAGRDATNQTEVACVLDELLNRAQHGPVDRPDARVAARTRAGAAAHRPPLPEQRPVEPTGPVERADLEVVPFGIFDADAEAERWI